MGIDISTVGIPAIKSSVAPAPSRLNRSADGRAFHVLTLTPFYPTSQDDAQGCFVAEPLPMLSNLGIVNTVVVSQPFYRTHTIRNRRAFPAQRVRFISLPGNFGLPAAGAFLFANLLSHVRALHRWNAIDMIHAHAALPCGHAAALLARELKIPFAVTVHGLDAYSTYHVPGRAGRWCSHVSNFVYSSASCVICISERVRDRVLAAARSDIKTEVVYNGVDPEKFHPPIDNVTTSTSTILCVANLIPIKGHDLLLRAFDKVQAQFPEWSCELIGDGPERLKLEKLAATLDINVVFRGRRSRAEVADAMRRCAIFALPSGYEGLGCVYLEAMATAKPAIGCLGQGIEEVIEHGANGLLVNPDNVQELENALCELMLNPRVGLELGQEARRTIVRGFTLEHQAERLAQIYRKYAA